MPEERGYARAARVARASRPLPHSVLHGSSRALARRSGAAAPRHKLERQAIGHGGGTGEEAQPAGGAHLADGVEEAAALLGGTPEQGGADALPVDHVPTRC